MLRCVDDEYQDEDGSRQTISASDLLLEVSQAPVGRAKKLNIPICPVTDRTAEYEAEVPGTYELPVSYIRLATKPGTAASGGDGALLLSFDGCTAVCVWKPA